MSSPRLAPRLTPDRTRSGRRRGMMWLTATSTQSVGVPSTAKRLGDSRRTWSGRRRVSEWAAPLCSTSGATTQTSRDSERATRSSTLSPGALMPSSLVTRMRAAARSSGPLSMLDHRQAAHMGPERRRDDDRAVGLLIVLEQRHQGAADGQRRAIERMHVACSLLARRPVAGLHAPGVKIAEAGAARDLAMGPLPRQPD